MNERSFLFWVKMLKPFIWYANLNGLVHVGVLIAFIFTIIGIIIGVVI